MIPSSAEIARSLTGAWLLFRRDPRGMALFDCSARGAWNSFFAAVIVAPLYIVLWLLRDTGGAFAAVGGERLIAVKAIGYAVGWLVFPVVVYEIARRMDRAGRFIPFVVAYNWTSVIQQGIYLGVGLIVTIGPFPPKAAGALTLAALAVALAYAWSVIRIALNVSGPVAAGLIALDFALGFLIAAVERGMVG